MEENKKSVSEVGMKCKMTIRQNKKGRTYATGEEQIRENKESEIIGSLK